MPSLRAVPARFRAKAVCNDKQPKKIPGAADLELGRETRSSFFTTPLGAMQVRWPRTIEKCFSSSPSRAISEAATAVNRAIRSARFDTELRSRDREWSLVFVDRASAVSQFPMQLSIGGHPGFMLPPNQIYIVVDFVSPGCRADEDSDDRLLRVLLHEMGHVLEYSLLGDDGFGSDRKRSEGFAAWFEGYSADFSSVIPEGSVQKSYRSLVSNQRAVGTSDFSGTRQDYALAALEFDTIVSRKGVGGLMALYSSMRDQRISFYQALQKKFGWDERALRREVRDFSSSSPR